jgi:hypothetical protein
MLILVGIFFGGVGVYLLVAPNDWGEDEWMRYDTRTRKSTLHPAIGGPLLIVIAVICIIVGIFGGIEDANKAQAERDAQTANNELSQAFSPIWSSLQERAEAQPGVMLTLTAGDRERAGLGLCTVDTPGNRFFVIVLDWHGKDYQRGFPGSVWGACGGSPEDYNRLLEGGSQVWIAIRPGSFNPDAIPLTTDLPFTATPDTMQLAPTETTHPTITATAEGN